MYGQPFASTSWAAWAAADFWLLIFVPPLVGVRRGAKSMRCLPGRCSQRPGASASNDSDQKTARETPLTRRAPDLLNSFQSSRLEGARLHHFVKGQTWDKRVVLTPVHVFQLGFAEGANGSWWQQVAVPLIPGRSPQCGQQPNAFSDRGDRGAADGVVVPEPFCASRRS